MSDPLVVVVYRYSQAPLCRILLYDILSLDLRRCRQLAFLPLRSRALLFIHHGLDQIDAFVADIDIRSDHHASDLRC